MARSNPLMVVAKHVAADMASGGPGEGVALAMAVIDRIPDAAEQLFDLIVAESGRKRPNAELIEALALMLGQALEALRFGIEAGEADARAQVEALRTRLAESVGPDAAGRDVVGIDALILMIRQFTVAGLDPGEDLRTLMVERVGAMAGPEDGEGGDPLEPLADMAAQVEDEFTLLSLIREMTGALPDEHRAALATAGFAPTARPMPGLERLREASIGWLFDPSPTVRRVMPALLGDAAARGLLSGTMLRRMITLRNWLPEGERAALDSAIRSARTKGVTVAPAAAAQVRDVYATGWDGAGAQSIFFVVKDGRRFAVAALLLKQEFGLRDAWVQRGGTRRDVDDLLANVDDQVGLVGSSVDYAAEATANALAINAASGSLPPFGLLDVAELAGLANLQPAAVAVEALLASLCGDEPPALPANGGEDALALRNSAHWPLFHPFTQSWFESGGAVEELLGRKRLAKAKAADLVIHHLLEDRRRVWAERIAWTAATLRRPPGKMKTGSGDWMHFARVARALLAGQALRDIPIMVTIAQTTVEVFAQHRRR